MWYVLIKRYHISCFFNFIPSSVAIVLLAKILNVKRKMLSKAELKVATLYFVFEL